MTVLCSQSAAAESLAGTAPPQTHLLLVEAPGSWGRDALADCSLPQPQRRALAALPPRWRVILVRRPDRPLRRQHDRFVWLSTPSGPALRWQVPVAAPIAPHDLPGTGEPVAEPTVFVCTNGGRDRCCAIFGRALFDDVAGPSTWECSHLGGHRFAPTALRLPDRMVFGRLDGATARAVHSGGTPLEALRGPAGWPGPVQAAVAAVWRRHGIAGLDAGEVRGDRVLIQLSDGTHWSVPVATEAIAHRLLSCGGDPVPGESLRTGPPVRLTGPRARA